MRNILTRIHIHIATVISFCFAAGRDGWYEEQDVQFGRHQDRTGFQEESPSCQSQSLTGHILTR